jgi:RNA polymerase sigma-70 factor (ECF subfamily)
MTEEIAIEREAGGWGYAKAEKVVKLWGRNQGLSATVVWSGRKLDPHWPPTGQALTETPRVDGDRPEADDFELLRNAANGDSAAFHKLIDRHSARLFRLAVSMVGNATDAEDVLQETFVGAFRGLKGFEARSTVKTWLTRILLTQSARWRRERQRNKAQSIDASDGGASIPAGRADQATGVGQRLDLQAALQQLTPEHREVLLLREFENLSYDEIAVALSVPRGTVESRLHRARGELREKLKVYLP